MNTPDTNRQIPNNHAGPTHAGLILDTLDSDTQRNLAVLALELLGCLANGTDKILDYELEEERDIAGLEAFYEENERKLRELRRL
jgi:hypothetical protein